MANIEVVICGHCGKSIRIVRSPKPLPNYLQCPNEGCGKNMMVEGVKIEPFEQRNLYYEHYKEREGINENKAEDEDLEDDIIKRLRRMIGND